MDYGGGRDVKEGVAGNRSGIMGLGSEVEVGLDDGKRGGRGGGGAEDFVVTLPGWITAG